MIKPLRDQIVVQRSKAEEVSRGGILIAPIAQEVSAEALVMAVGSGKVMSNGTVVPLEVKVGDKVLLARKAYEEVVLGDEEYTIVKEENILAIVP